MKRRGIKGRSLRL